MLYVLYIDFLHIVFMYFYTEITYSALVSKNAQMTVGLIIL